MTKNKINDASFNIKIELKNLTSEKNKKDNLYEFRLIVDKQQIKASLGATAKT